MTCDPDLTNHLILYGSQAKRAFYTFKWLKKVKRRNISRHVKIIWSLPFSVHKWRFFGTQPYSFLHTLSMELLCWSHGVERLWPRSYVSPKVKYYLALYRKSLPAAVISLQSKCGTRLTTGEGGNGCSYSSFNFFISCNLHIKSWGEINLGRLVVSFL